MLDVMRENIRHLKPILWIVLISMVAYLGAYFSCDDSARTSGEPWAARVDGTEISVSALQNTARLQDEYYRQALGPQFDQFRSQLHLGQQAVRTLIDRQIILLEAEKLGLGASKAEIEKAVLQDPRFHGPDGKFIGTERYVELAGRMFVGGAGAYESDLRERIIFTKWRDTVASPAQVSDEELLQIYRSRSDRTTIDYVVVAGADQDVDREVDGAAAQAWYGAHPNDYLRPEGLRLKVVTVSRQDQLAQVQVSDEEIESYYDDHESEFTRPAERRASHILLKVPSGAPAEADAAARARAEELRGRIAAGESFEQLAREFSEDELSAQRGGDLDFFPRGAMVPEFETAVFGNAVGALAPVTRTSYGYHVIRVTEERPAGAIPIAEAREGIRDRMKRDRADDAAEALARKIRAAATSAADLEAAAGASGQRAEETVVRRGAAIAGVDAPQGFVEELFDLEAGALGEPTATMQGWAVIGVVETVPASVAPFEEVESAVKSAVVAQRSSLAAEHVARAALSRHGSVAKAAKALGLEVLDSGSLTPAQPPARTGGASPELREMLFGPGAVVGATGVARVPAGAVIFEVKSREVFDPAEFERTKGALRAEILDQRRGELLEAVMVQLRRGYEIEINDAAVKSVDA